MSLRRTVPGRGTLAVLDTDPPLVIYMGHAGYPLADVSGQGGFLKFRSSSGGSLLTPPYKVSDKNYKLVTSTASVATLPNRVARKDPIDSAAWSSTMEKVKRRRADSSPRLMDAGNRWNRARGLAVIFPSSRERMFALLHTAYRKLDLSTLICRGHDDALLETNATDGHAAPPDASRERGLSILLIQLYRGSGGGGGVR
ncbi:hypothetical protein K0M31_007581 [Melipona bicolor]|uniref:Uncharacterized protein n=1 Tax=Melipona bicolor TaxID=60889 RepID=A0AA40GCI6_9HYME|nr:hypothetical protein K0M31_007581 [Melipona bicolor]